MKKQRFLLIDGHSILFRAFHAYPPLTTADGELVNAVYGFTNILLSVIRDLEPKYIAVSFDRAAPTFRHKQYAGYKAHRPEAPADLVKQQDRVEEIVSILNIPIFALEGYEADDVIGTLTRQAADKTKRLQGKGDLQVIIVTGDRDMLQLVDEHKVLVCTPVKGKEKAKLWDLGEVHDYYGLTPEQIVDYKALVGDASDEIPGVRGIGPKTATALLHEYGKLKGVYKHINDVKTKFGMTVQSKLVEGKEQALLSYKLAAIFTDVPIKLSLKKCMIHDYDKTKAIKKFEELEFKSLVGKLPNDSFEQMVQEELFSK